MKGKVGYVDSWVEDDREDSAFDAEKRVLRYVPQVVFVQFYEKVWSEELQDYVWSEELQDYVQEPCKWVIDGVDRPGVYPIFPWKRSWHLDQHRQHPKLEVKRFQIPLAPS